MTMSSQRSGARRKGLLGAALLIVFLLLLLGLRAYVLAGITTGLTDCTWCMGATAVQQDSSILALLLALTGLSLLTARYWLQLPWMLLSALLLLAYGVDAVLLKTLAQHLYLNDIAKFGKEISAIGRFSDVLLASALGKLMLAGVVVALAVLVLALLPRPRRPRAAVLCFAAAGLCFLIGLWSPMTMKYINYPLLQNFIAANLGDSVDRRYSPSYAQALRQAYVPPAPSCGPGRNVQPNLIVLTVESLSMYHSKLFGGTNNYTPNLDAIALSNTYFPDFIANGFTTDGGLISLITGKAPVPSLGRYQSFEAFAGFESPQAALPEIVHAHGYTANFFTTGDLGFLDKPKWLKEVGFDAWEGAEHPFYDGWKRRHFNAAEDKALYQRFLQWLDARQGNAQPWLSVLLTVSTHPPFINPENESQDEAGVFAYADKQIGMLYAELERRDFFRNGVLMVVGDHRSMTPLTPQEFARFGDSALARVPFVVATQLPIAKGAVAGKFQQADAPSSIAALLGTQACRTDRQGDLLSMPPQPAKYVVHVRGDRRKQLDIYFDGQQAGVELAGDDSKWLGAKPENWKQIMDGISLDRIGRGGVEENALDFMIDILAPKASPSPKD